MVNQGIPVPFRGRVCDFYPCSSTLLLPHGTWVPTLAMNQNASPQVGEK